MSETFREIGYMNAGKVIRNENYELAKDRMDKQDDLVLRILTLLNNDNERQYHGKTDIYLYLNKTSRKEQLNALGERLPLSSIGRSLNTLAGRNKKMQLKDIEYVPLVEGKGSKETLRGGAEEIFRVRTWQEVTQDRAARKNGQSNLLFLK